MTVWKESTVMHTQYLEMSVCGIRACVCMSLKAVLMGSIKKIDGIDSLDKTVHHNWKGKCGIEWKVSVDWWKARGN